MKEAEENKQVKDQMEEARKVSETQPGVLSMKIDIPEDGQDEPLELEDDVKPTRKIPERKTKAERRKAEKQKAEVYLLKCCLLVIQLSIVRRRNACYSRNSLKNGCLRTSTPRNPYASQRSRHNKRGNSSLLDYESKKKKNG